MSSFLHPGILWGLGLAAVPILIHLLNRRRYTTVRWAAQDFLRLAFRKNQKRLRMENLLLLLIRTALIILLVFALARPFLEGRLASALSTESEHYTVLLDNSYSMGLNEGVETPFSRGVKEAQKIVTTLGPEDSFTLYLPVNDFSGSQSGAPQAVIRDSHDQEKVKGILGRIAANRPSAGRAVLADTLTLLADQLDSRRPGNRVVIITDMQRAFWETERAAGTAPDRPEPGAATEGRLDGSARTIREVFEDFNRKGASIDVIDVGAAAPENAAIVDFAPERDRPLVEGNMESFIARVRNYGRRDIDADVVFKIDGELKGSRRIQVPPARALGAPGEAVARFQMPPLKAGPHAYTAEIPTDGVAVDDERVFAATVREKIRVLAVDGDPNADAGLTAETIYLKNAIAPLPDRIEVEVIDPLAFLNKKIDKYDILVLANLERIREDKVVELEEFVRAGGGLVSFLGNRVDPGLANRDLVKDGEGLYPGTIAPEAVVGPRNEGRTEVDLTPNTHPLIAQVLGPQADPEGFWTDMPPRVWGYYPVTPIPNDPNVSVLLRLTDPEASPLLLERKFGEGRVLLFTTSPDLDWNDFPNAGVMIPLLHEMVYYLTHRDPSASNLTPFATYARDLEDRVEEVTVLSPDGGRTRVTPIVKENRKARMEFRDTGVPGIYRAEFSVRGSGAIDAGTRLDTALFSVNVDAREGDLRVLTGPELAERYAGVEIGLADSFSGRVEAAAEAPRGEIWKALLIAVLVLLFLETLLAWRFGQGGRHLGKKEVAG